MTTPRFTSLHDPNGQRILHRPAIFQAAEDGGVVQASDSFPKDRVRSSRQTQFVAG